MSSLLLDLLPFALGLAATPTAIAIGILFLGSQHPVGNALAFAGAFTLVYSVLAGLVVGAAAAAGEPLLSDHDKAVAALVVGSFLLLLGVIVLSRRRSEVPERSRLLAMIEDANELEAFGIGLVLSILNPNIPILFGGLAAVAAADESTGVHVVGAVVLVAAAVCGLLGPIVWFVVDHERAERGLDRLKGWLARHQSTVNIAVLFGFGTVFVVKGLTGLS